MPNSAFEIVRSKVESDKISDFVALANLLNKAESYHSAFVIQYERKLYEFHYTGTAIEFCEMNKDYYHKITNTILPDEIPSFIAQCKNIEKIAKPQYGFFYSGESYDIYGNHLSETDLGERMTCVGFCLNVLKGFLEEDYLNYSDWTSESHDDESYLETFCANNGIEISKISNSHRRITPRECLISGFFDKLPISKAYIDSKKNDVDDHFKDRLRVAEKEKDQVL